MVLYIAIKNINNELNVKAKYCPQWIPIESIPELSNCDFAKIFYRLHRFYKVIR